MKQVVVCLAAIIMAAGVARASDDDSRAPAATAVPSSVSRVTVTRIGVADLELTGVDPRVGRIVTSALVLELRKLVRVSVVSMDDVRAMLDLEAQKQLLGCNEDSSCLSEIAEAMGVDVLVVGQLASFPEQSTVTLRRIDQRSASVGGATAQRLNPAQGEELLAAVGPAVEKLFPDVPLRAGQKRGVDPRLALRLNPPPLDPWVFYGTVGAGGVAAGTAGGLAVMSAVAAASYDKAVAEAQTSDTPFATLDAARQQANATAVAAWTVGAVAIAAFAAAGAEALVTDWDGSRGAAEESE